MEWWLGILAAAGWLAGAMILGLAYRQPWRRPGRSFPRGRTGPGRRRKPRR